ncbi:unnamed protein product [Peniophora sp. CBMAI 1063]|nr:unnamed protein product [Peniophora sp. CBMAI 1063]
MRRSPSVRSYRTYNASSDALSDLYAETEFETDYAPSSPSKSPRKRLAAKQRGSQHANVADEDRGIPAFDAYFSANAQPSRTSTNVFTQLVQPLTSDEFTEALSAPSDYLAKTPASELPAKVAQTIPSEYSRWERELDAGFNLLFYGMGSKRGALNDFVTRRLRKKGHIIVLNAFNPHFALKDIYPALEQLLPTESDDDVSGTILERAALHFDQPTETKKGKGKAKAQKPLYLVIHNFDAPAIRGGKARAALDQLISAQNVRCLASLDHLNAPLLFSSSSLLSSSAASTGGSSSAERGAWLWHDLTTLAPYFAELAFADPGSLRAARTTADPVPGVEGPGAGQAQMTESAAQHVLLSVTAKAKKLFDIVAAHQLAEEADESAEGDAAKAGEDGDKEKGIPYDRLFALARDNFVATSDGALRALLGEFRDHGLVVTASTGAMGAGETLWIPMRKERLVKLVAWLKEGGS